VLQMGKVVLTKHSPGNATLKLTTHSPRKVKWQYYEGTYLQNGESFGLLAWDGIR